MKKKLVVLSGAGVSAESGVATFRDAGGLWEGHNVMDVASPEGFRKNPALVLDFYNQRRRQLFDVQPNDAHKIIASLEADFDVNVITQNVDDLHERGGSTHVLHLHGELLKARCTVDENAVIDWTGDIAPGQKHPDTGRQLRPHIVWFGEMVPTIEAAVTYVEQADYIIVVGTSMQVYPAAGLVDFARRDAKIFYIDLNPADVSGLNNKVEVLAMKASEGMGVVRERLLQ
ncbi:SIR2 family NAD-dependent protein deacylase [Flavobacterium sp. RHBU_24]|uniref:SIR2 family NAD-dependent protein deacylase n=1 Tax=Flavobacterium sp. RHBU_24 TaxID=3391185 RepID=UPI0039853599